MLASYIVRGVKLRAAILLLTILTAIAIHAQIADIRQPIRLENGKLIGRGAETLLKTIKGARFVVMGEDHGFAEIPQFISALWDAKKFDGLVIETGPIAAAELERMLRQSEPREQLALFLNQYPAAVPFYGWEEEFAFLEHVAGSRPQAKKLLIGVDQEFVMSPSFLLTRIIEQKPSAAVRAQAERMLKQSDAATNLVKNSEEMGRVYMFTSVEEDFQRLVQLARRDKLAVRRIAAQLLATRQIYGKYQQNQGYESNRQRAQLMKRNLIEAVGTGALARPPSLMVKVGANHGFRGLNPLNSSEIGSYVSEWSEGLGLGSVHVLVLAKRGTQARFGNLTNTAQPREFDATKDESLAFAGRFFEIAPDNEWSLFDLRAFRGTKSRQFDPAVQRLVYGYDFLVVIPQAQASKAVR